MWSWNNSFCNLCFQMSDRGGGVPFRRTERLFSYMYSTAPRPCIGDKHRAPLVSRTHIHTQSHTHTHTHSRLFRSSDAAARTCVCAGGLRLRASHLPSLRSLLPGRLTAVLHGGERDRRHHPPEGKFALRKRRELFKTRS